jgi:hypothetical protein
MIKGNVMDISSGTKSSTIAPRFPNGVPAISDDDTTPWMDNVYMEQPRPTNAKGVPVTIDVIDSNGNYRNVGNTTNNADGFYSLAWKPDIPGKYTVIASFGGSESYWPSHAQTAFAVDEAATTPIQQPALALPPTETYIVGSSVAIIVAIAIVGLLLLRRKP